MFGVKKIVPVVDKRFDQTPFMPACFCNLKTQKEYLLAPKGVVYQFQLPHYWQVVNII